MTSPSPVPDGAEAELARIVRRWGQLPVEAAAARAPRVREVVDGLAGEPTVDLGPAVLLDQLRVLTWDACAQARDDGDAARLAEVEGILTALRRDL